MLTAFFSLLQVFYVYFIMLHLEIITSMLNDDSSSAHLHPKTPVSWWTISCIATQNRPVVLPERDAVVDTTGSGGHKDARRVSIQSCST